MKRIDIKVTSKCNNHCKFCVRGDKRLFLKDKTAGEIRKELKSSRLDCDEVIFTGGEPTVRADILELITFARKLGYAVQMQTNGRMLARADFCKDIIRAGAQVFSVSVHGHIPKLHDYLTGSEGSHRESVAGIRTLLALGKPVVTNTVITKLNYRFLPKISQFLADLGLRQYQFAFPHIMGKALENIESVVPRKKEIMPYLKLALDIGVKRKLAAKTEAIPYCFLKGYEDCVAEKDVPDTRVVDIEVTDFFVRWRKEQGKVKGPQCNKCTYFKICEGPWREYPEIFGWSEFKPVL